MTLAGVLADLLAGANEAKLDSCAADRHSVAADFVAFTDRMTAWGREQAVDEGVSP